MTPSFSVIVWNDTRGRTKKQVLAVIDKAIEGLKSGRITL
jgi:hypothetical protein